MKYWTNKEKNAEVARKHYEKMEQEEAYNINYSAKFTTLVKDNLDTIAESEGLPENKNKTTIVKFPLCTTDRCLFNISSSINIDNDIGILNFASYKNPGGKFLEGSMAQEESLCHVSALANILNRHMDDFYIPHRRQGAVNRGLYYNEALVSPQVPFKWEDLCLSKRGFCTVITCAAPNAKTFLRYHNSNADQILVYETFYKRIYFILNIAKAFGLKTLILGAFGCGVFGNDAHCCARYFRQILMSNEFIGAFEKIYFAIPDNYTMRKFIDVFFDVKGERGYPLDLDGDLDGNLILQAIPIVKIWSYFNYREIIYLIKYT